MYISTRWGTGSAEARPGHSTTRVASPSPENNEERLAMHPYSRFNSELSTAGVKYSVPERWMWLGRGCGGSEIGPGPAFPTPLVSGIAWAGAGGG